MNRRARTVMPSVMTMAVSICMAPMGMAPPAVALEPGEYEVTVRLDLPHVEGATEARTVHICVTSGSNGPRGKDTRGLAPLIADHAFAGCAASHIREDGGTLTFDLVCPGPNSAAASASYALGEHDFDGRIVMTMGGKNMTMTESQRGRRTGVCGPPA
jgi:hypothetical protein